MKKIIITALLSLSITGCLTGNSNKLEAETDTAKNTMAEKAAVIIDQTVAIKVQSPAPCTKGAIIAENIRKECQIGEQLSTFIASYSVGNGLNSKLQDQVTENTEGNALVVEITDAVSSGNAFIGHRKYTRIKGSLFNDGNKLAAFTAARVSGGGAFGGFKGSFSVLGRTVKVPGKEIGRWLKNPVDGVHPGDGV